MVVLRGLGQALLLVLAGVALGCAAAGVWVAVAGGGFGSRLGISLLVIAGLSTVTGGTLLSRPETSTARAFLGLGPERDADQPAGPSALGPVGVFLFVTLPLAALGLFLLD
ncbi:hypothetical protein SAMN04488107_1316 [Geodermatophilus saharensis]|uniref:Uncharacterized protein n=1 Tax=Geodermatophilus saharensis TaxID=1137994 RepID=A0A239BM18_9ACTN|nr:hypothetical protein [Geodermatophilus saharensis]SNS09227.1 hypothetical protein SAMN04488107_1316 [Geodermatophilus saharensis]